MNDFTLNLGTKIYFGDYIDGVGAEVKKYGKNVLLTYGGGSIKKSGLYDRIINSLKKENLTVLELNGIEPNPKISSVREGAKICKENGVQVLLAVGGGSTIDATKFISAGAYYNGDPWDLSTGKGKIEKALPIVTVLTLSATGSEMNTGGVISNPETNEKLGMLNPNLLPKASFLDPKNTFTVSAFQTACGSADIISHTLEQYFCTENDLYLLDGVMESIIKTVIRYTPIAMANPTDYEARANLMWSSTWALNNFVRGGKLHSWTCHPIEHELSAFYDITHGLGLAIVTPRYLEYALNETNAKRYRQLAKGVFGIDGDDDMQIAKEFIDKLSEFFFKTCGLSSTLTEIGITDKYFKQMAEKAERGGTKNGFIALDKKGIEEILYKCL